jgi:hypothetical protein
MHDGDLCLEIENFGCHIFEGPEIQGSRTMVNELLDWPGEGGKGRIGLKVRRNEASEFRCLTAKDIFKLVYDLVERIRRCHFTKKLVKLERSSGE